MVGLDVNKSLGAGVHKIMHIGFRGKCEGLEFRVEGLGFRIWGLGVRV